MGTLELESPRMPEDLVEDPILQAKLKAARANANHQPSDAIRSTNGTSADVGGITVAQQGNLSQALVGKNGVQTDQKLDDMEYRLVLQEDENSTPSEGGKSDALSREPSSATLVGTDSQPATFSALINKDKGKLGVTVDFDNPGMLIINTIHPGETNYWSEVNYWNANHSARRRASIGDRIVSVNDVNADAKTLFDMLHLKWSVKLEIRQHREFQVEIDNADGGLDSIGIGMKRCGMTLLITKVQEIGLIAVWNAAHPDLKVRKGDRIVAVDGQPSSGDGLKKRLRKAIGLVALTVSHVDR